MVSSCDSRYNPRTVPDNVPPIITVRLTGEELNKTYTIQGMTITPPLPYETPDLNPGKTYSALIVASDTIGLYNLKVSLNKDFFEISDITASPGTMSSSEMGQYTVINVTLPFSPAKTGTLLSFNFKAKPMSQGIIAPFLGFNILATDFGEVGRTSNISGHTIPIAYFAE